ncbi:MAG: hypothetical protein IJD64_05445 [Clostridia bacterium]|nr:hypothetical protein [Clostridia bacterium]
MTQTRKSITVGATIGRPCPRVEFHSRVPRRKNERISKAPSERGLREAVEEPAGRMMFSICVSLRTLLQSLRDSSLSEGALE